MVLAQALALVAATQLIDARVDVTVNHDIAHVNVSYNIHQESAFAFHAIRLPGQHIQWDSDDPLPIDSLDGVYRIQSGRTGQDTILFGFSYVVAGNIDRVPILVPDVSTNPVGNDDIAITVRGVPDGVNLQNGFPRMARQSDGSVASAPANLPSFLVVPLRARRFSTDTIADAFVIAMLMFASGVWLYRTRTRWRV